MNRLFNFTSKPAPELTKEPLRALPASWYRSASMYELERRAVFSKKWMVASHRQRFADVGDYIQITIAGIAIFIIKDRQGNIKAHHNVCRHRAYPVVEQEAGKASILACRYHGWSYGLDGRLAKAPKYQDVEGFDKTANSLFPVHVHEDQLGFIWINLDSSATPVPWTQDYEGVDTRPRMKTYDLTNYTFDHQWSITGNFNWKTLADNYNECYHCPTGHPGIAGYQDFTKYYVETKGGQIEHWNTEKEGEEGKFQILSSFLYPNATITVAPAFFYIGRWIPTSAGETRMEYEYYRRSDGTSDDKDFQFYVETFKQVLQEDKDLCTAAQKNLSAGIFQNGQLHPGAEKGPLYFQHLTKMLVMAHHEEEQQNGGLPIWPAVPKHSVTAANETEIAFCANLACGERASQEKLHW